MSLQHCVVQPRISAEVADRSSFVSLRPGVRQVIGSVVIGRGVPVGTTLSSFCDITLLLLSKKQLRRENRNLYHCNATRTAQLSVSVIGGGPEHSDMFLQHCVVQPRINAEVADRSSFVSLRPGVRHVIGSIGNGVPVGVILVSF
jgi:hypothetical protein